MQTLEALAREAARLADGTGAAIDLPAGRPQTGDPEGTAAPTTSAEAEVTRQMQICNACRYCEGFCAVFPAMTRRLTFGEADVHYLANLCHNCGACLHACQYAPPHEFAVNVPRAMAAVRRRTYQVYAWPAPLGRLYQRNGLTLAVALAAGMALFLLLAVAGHGRLFDPGAAGDFYAVFPHNLMVGLFGPVFLFVTAALAIGVRRFWRDVSPATGGQVGLPAPAAGEAAGAVLRLRYLDGGHGDGCNDEDDRFTLRRRRFHHLTFYGFLLCFAATSLGTIYHYGFGLVAPYDLPSLPKVLGALGGLGLLVGPAGLWRLNRRRDPLHGDPAQKPMDLGFIALLFLTSATGLTLWGLRGTAAMPLVLCLHLGAVMALFLTLPYGKFAHGIYRTAALLRQSIEKRLPDRLGLAGD